MCAKNDADGDIIRKPEWAVTKGSDVSDKITLNAETGGRLDFEAACPMCDGKDVAAKLRAIRGA